MPVHKRIESLDGLRAISALGVLWIHVWIVFGNPAIHVGPFDVKSILALGGNGIDLFFAISGFCMFYFYKPSFASHKVDFIRFVKRRWLRLSPAFYFATLAYLAFRYVEGRETPYLLNFLTSVFYLNVVLPRYNAEGLFWTLSLEWQFYLVLPILFFLIEKHGFRKAFVFVLLSNYAIAILLTLFLKDQSDYFTNQIFFRYVEFAGGIIVARFYSQNKTVKNKVPLLIAVLFGIGLGRVLVTNQALQLSQDYYNLIRLAGFTLMACGFSTLLLLTITSRTWLKAIFSHPLLCFLGQISYSFYLWHGMVHLLVARYIRETMLANTEASPVSTFFISVFILIPISYLSYVLFEKWPLQKRKTKMNLSHFQ